MLTTNCCLPACLPACLVPSSACLPLCSPKGTYSGVGAWGVEACNACPAGQFNPSDGLGDQTLAGSTLKCLACPIGSLPLNTVGQTTSSITTTTSTITGAFFCDAW